MTRRYFDKTYTTGATITAGSLSTERYISDDDITGYGPFDTVICDNKAGGDVDMEIYFDGDTDNPRPIPKGAVVEFNKLAFLQFKLKNVDGSASHTAGNVKVNVIQSKRPRRG